MTRKHVRGDEGLWALQASGPGATLVFALLGFVLAAPANYLLEQQLAQVLDSGVVQLAGRIMAGAIGVFLRGSQWHAPLLRFESTGMT